MTTLSPITAVDLTVVLTVQDAERVSEVRDLLKLQAELSLQEPGCLRFEVYEATSAEKTFILIERWQSRQALDVHRTAHAFQTVYGPKVIPLVDRTPYVCAAVR